MEKYIHTLFNEKILIEASKYYDIQAQDLYMVGGFENYIYGFTKNNTDYIMRISHSSHRSLEQVEAELDFVNYLAENKANVSLPIKSINNRLVEKVNCLDGSYFTISVYHKVPGTRPTRDSLTDRFFINYGKTIGRFHQLTKTYQAKETKRYQWYEDPLFINAHKYLDKNDAIIHGKFMSLINKIKQYSTNSNNYGLIHTDIHMGNFFVKDDELCVFDFDDTSYMYFISDIAIALFYYVQGIQDTDKRNETADKFMSLFMEGYKSENHLNKEDFLTITDFLKLREMVLYIVFHRSSDLENEPYAKRYVDFYRARIINDIPFVDIDFNSYL